MSSNYVTTPNFQLPKGGPTTQIVDPATLQRTLQSQGETERLKKHYHELSK
jgi:hypothetical protein